MTKLKLAGIILTLIGIAGLIYALVSQFTNGMDKSPVAGITLVSLIILLQVLASYTKNCQIGTKKNPFISERIFLNINLI